MFFIVFIYVKGKNKLLKEKKKNAFFPLLGKRLNT